MIIYSFGFLCLPLTVTSRVFGLDLGSQVLVNITAPVWCCEDVVWTSAGGALYPVTQSSLTVALIITDCDTGLVWND